MPRVFIALNDRGARIGETHPRAKLSDATVDLIREMHEDRGWSYNRIAIRLKLSYHTVLRICRYERRAQTPARWVLADGNGRVFKHKANENDENMQPYAISACARLKHFINLNEGPYL